MEIIEYNNIFNEDVFIDLKIKYINTLLRSGFDILNFGEFKSSNSMYESNELNYIFKNLYLQDVNTKIMVDASDVEGFNDLINFKDIEYINYPFLIPKEFLNLNKYESLIKEMDVLDDINNLINIHNKKLMVYISLKNKDSYNYDLNIELILNIVDELLDIGVTNINISDNIGLSKPEIIENLFVELYDEFPAIDFGFHLQDNKNWYNKIKIVYDIGVDRFISDLNKKPYKINTKDVVDFCFDNDIETNIDDSWLKKSINLTKKLYK